MSCSLPRGRRAQGALGRRVARQQACQAARPEAPELRAIFDAATVPMVSVDLQGRVMLWNRRMEELLGLAARRAHQPRDMGPTRSATSTRRRRLSRIDGLDERLYVVLFT